MGYNIKQNDDGSTELLNEVTANSFKLGADDSITWSMSDDSTDTSTATTFALTTTGAGASVDGSIFSTTTAVALGTYANALNGKLNFGSAGSATGLGGAICAELDLGAGTSSGSYCCFEGEMILGTSASTGTRTSFFSLNLSGAGKTAFDSNGFLFDLNGLTAGASNLFASNAKTGIAMTNTLKCQIGGTTYYIALHTSANFGGS